MTAFTTLRDQIEAYQPDADVELLERAFRFSREAHSGQSRASGEEYIFHPLAVAGILAELHLDSATLAAALLHDVVEDTEVTIEDLRREFGDEIALLVDGVTKLGKIQFRSRMEEQAENLRKMLLAMAQDIRVILIKLADRLHNMRTLASLPEAKQRAIAEETLEVFAPLAHRLGIFRIKWELEDLALRYLQPEAYRDLSERIPKKRQEREEFAQVVMNTLREKLGEAGIESDISGRAKHFYSIYRKMYGQGRDLSEIYDLVAIRVIVDSVKDCYGALGVVHTLWRPIPGRFKDYIATPKSNMYQSLHTTVVGPQGEPFEIQIRTWEMHRTAEYGIAAHWRYKEGKTDRDFDMKVAWLREVLEWQKDLRDAREFMDSLRMDVFSDEVFVFTPKGDVIDLPAGATPIDFAYRIHTEVGHRCVGAKVNGKIVPLDTALKNGDIIEILTSKQSAGPSRDWLNIVQTSSAKNRIRQWFKREQREENLERGRELIEKEIRRLGFEADDLMKDSYLLEVAEKSGFQSADDLFVTVGFGGVTPAQVANRLKQQYRAVHPAPLPSLEELTRRQPKPAKPSDGVRVKGIDNVLVRFSRCCNPVPGDDIVGYITRGRGVSIHRTDCPNVANLLEDDQRVIEVSWDEVDAASYPVEIAISGLDRPGLLSDVAQVLAESHTNILTAKARSGDKRNLATIDMVLEVRSLEQLEVLRRRIQRVRDVFTVERVERHTS